MARYTQTLCSKGSQRWMQWFVNRAPEVLSEHVGLGTIDWRSPLAGDEYAEYSRWRNAARSIARSWAGC